MWSVLATNSRPLAADSGNSQVVVLWGMNPLNTLKIAWSSTHEQGLEYIPSAEKIWQTSDCH